MEFPCIAVLHIVYVIPEETCSVCIRKCGMCTRYNRVCIHKKWHSLGDLLPRMTPSVTIWGWLMHNWIMWHFFPCGSHCAWFFVPLLRCKEPSHYVCKGVWAQEAAGETGNSSACVFKLEHLVQLLAYKNWKVNWLECDLYLSQKVQSQKSTKSVNHCDWVVTERWEAC